MFNPGNNKKNADLNPREISQFGKKSAKVYHCLYSTTEELQMALWAYIYLRLGFNNDSLYSHPPSQISPSPISPSLVLPLQTLRLLS